MYQKPLLLLSIPNSGTDWLASTICNSQSNIKYLREFFNPGTNTKYSDILAEEFGCEYINCYKNIISFNETKTTEIFEQTWKKEDYNFTKDNFGIMRMPFYKKHFNCFGLKRSCQTSLPPKRYVEVTGWYLAIYESLLQNKQILPKLIQVKIDHFNSKNTKIAEKLVFAFCIYQEIFIYYCKINEIPILDYDKIVCMNDNDLLTHLESLKYNLNYATWSSEIIKTRKEIKKDFDVWVYKWVINTYATILI